MNKVYRVVRSKIDGRLVVASEIARSAVKGKGASIVSMSVLLMANAAYGQQVAPAIGGPAVAVDNSKTVVDIQAPVNGISHNRFTAFNVGSTPVLLNNVTIGLPSTYDPTGSSSVVTSLSSGASTVNLGANLNLGANNPAAVIVNEVLSNVGAPGSASRLAGTLEVVGHKADVVIANPYGITVNNGSFVNAGDVVLVTGSVASTAADEIKFQLSNNNLSVEASASTGANALTAEDLALISRRITVNGKIQADQLRLVAHNGQVRYTPGSGALNTSGTGATTSALATSYTIDSSALGGMYANRIAVLATEAGAGVRVRGDMAALGDAITIDANGNLVVGDAAQAMSLEANSVTLSSNADGADVNLTRTSVQALPTQGVATTGGAVSITAGSAQARGDITLDSTDLRAVSGSSTSTPQGNIGLTGRNIQDLAAGSVSADRRLAVSASGALTVNRSDWAAQTVGINAQSVSVDAEGTLSATNTNGATSAVFEATSSGAINIAGELNLGAGSSSLSSSASSIMLASTAVVRGEHLAVSAQQNATLAQGAQVQTTGNLSVVAATVVSESDVVTAGDLTLGHQDGTTRVGLGSADESTLTVAGDLNLAGVTIDVFSDLQVSGTAQLGSAGHTQIASLAETSAASVGALNVATAIFNLEGSIAVGTGGGAAVTATSTATVSQTGRLTTADASLGQTWTLGASMVNRGQLQSAASLTIGDGTNGSELINTGSLIATDDVLINVAGLAYNKATVTGSTPERNLGTAYDGSTSASSATYENKLTVDEAQLGWIQSKAGDVTIQAANTINEADIEAAGTLDLSQTQARVQLAGIWNGSSHAGSSRESLMGPRTQYDYVQQAGVESYATDDHLLIGRANYQPTLKANTITGNSILNIGAAISGQVTGSVSEVDISPHRDITTVVAPLEAPATGSGTVELDGSAPVIVDGQTQTSVELASNQATWVVHIAEPNAAGLSNNSYSSFNINSNGLIFNNTPFKQSVTVVTDLSAEIVSNPTLLTSASVILNQVYGAAASKLNGFMEVAGPRADVLIANPYGIACDSCGVINVDRLDLVVGTVGLNEGRVNTLSTSSQAAAAFSLVGSGLDATQAHWTSVIAPEAVVAASLNAKSLYMGLGAGSFSRGADPAVGYARLQTSDGAHAETLTVMHNGGVFADTITVDSFAQGIHGRTRIYGELAANRGDLSLNTDGVISINGRLSAAADLSLRTNASGNSANIAAADLQLLDGSITAGGQLVVDAASGSMVFNGGQIYSFNDLSFSGVTFVDEGTVNPAQFNNTRFAGGELSFDISGTMRFKGTSWEADIFRLGRATAPEQRPELTLGEGTIFKALSLLDAHLKSLDNSGTMASLGDSQINASFKVNNAAMGVMTSANSSTLTVPTWINAGQWIGSQAATNEATVNWQVNSITNTKTGELASSAVWQVIPIGSAALNWVNDGKVNSSVALHAKLNNLTNSGEMVISLRDSAEQSDWSLSGTLTNKRTGTLFAGGDWGINAAGVSDASKRGRQLINDGTLQGYQDLQLGFQYLTLPKGAEISGALSGAGSLDIGLTVGLNFDALLYSNHDMLLNFGSNFTVLEDGAFIANGNAAVNLPGRDFINYGLVYAGGDLSFSSKRLGNFSQVTVNRSATRLGTSAVDGKTYYEGKQTLVSSSELRAGGDMSINASEMLVNSADVRAGGALSITAPTIVNQVPRLLTFDTTNPLTNTNDRELNSSQSEQSEDGYEYPDKFEYFSRTTTWEEFDYFKDGTPARNPIMLAGGGFTLTGQRIYNYGGLIQSTGSSAASVINASVALVNDALAKDKESYNWVEKGEIKYIALGPLTYHDTRWEGDKPSSGTLTNLSAGKAVIETGSGSLSITGGSVTNVGSFVPTSPGAVGAGSAAVNPNGFTLNVSLPSSPNGFFVTNRDPSAKYLVEMNPKLQPGVSTLGSDYLMENLNVNSDTTTRRLGDAGYEAYLVEQQLLEATGKAVLDGYDNIADVMQGFMNNAVAQAGSLGLSMGEALSDEQLAALDEPIVWMVEVEVDGQKVLAPKVYLPKKLLEEIEQEGAVISANDLSMNVASLDNLGGTLEADNNLDITSKGDINNVSGAIKGGNVSLESTDGSINNTTFNQYAGNELSGQTVIGKTATIEASNDLSMKAAGDIKNLGAQVSAGNNANLEAGGNITFDTVEDVKRSYELSGSTGISGSLDDKNLANSQVSLTTSVTETQTKTVTQVKSGLSVGGDLSSKSGGDTTFAGTDVNVGGNADVKSDGDINIIARENSSESSSTTRSSSIGLGPELLSTSTTTTDSRSIRNQGSTFNVGGNASFDGKGDMTIQGSELNVSGDASIEAKSLNVLAGRDLDETNTTTEKTSIGIAVETMENVDGSTSQGVTFGQTSTETTKTLSQRSQGSALNVGGNLDVKVEKDVTLQGSEVDAGGNVAIEAENVRLLAAQNIERTETTKTTVKMGLYASATAEGEAGTETNTEAGAEAGSDTTSTAATGNASASAGASAGASASGSASATLDFAVGRTDNSRQLEITNTGSAIKSGGNLKIDAKKKIELEGSEVVAQGDVDIKATDIEARAARDVSINEQSSESVRVGLYAEASGSAEAGASASAGAEASGAAGISASANEASAGAKAEAGAEAEGKAGVGLQTQVAKLTEKETTITSQVSAIRSTGGSVSRTATNSIVDVGTELEAAKNFTQSANTITSLAARNETISERTYDEVTAKAGIYAQAEGEAKAEAGAEANVSAEGGGAEAGAQASAEGGARVGVEVQVDTLSEKERQRNTQAVTSNIKVGGNFSSTSSGASTFEGTSIQAGGDLNVQGQEINITAARNTSESESSSVSTSSRVAVAVGVGGSAQAGASVNSDGEAEAGAEAEGGVKVRAEVETNVETQNETSTETQAVTASFTSGGNVNLKAQDDVNIEGADINAANAINVDAKELNFKAAQNTQSSTSSSTSVGVSATVEATVIGSTGVEGEVEVGVDTSNGSAQSSQAVTGSLSSRNLNIKTQGDANFEGTNVTATDGAKLDVGGNLNVTAAANTSSAQEDSTSVSVEASASSDGEFNASAGVGVSKSQEQSSEAVVAKFNVGNLDLKTGGNANFEGTELQATGDANLDVGGDLNVTAARNTSSSSATNVEVEVGVGLSDKKEDDGSAEKGAGVEASAAVEIANSKSSEAVTGLLGAGGKLNIKTGGNATFEGTDLGAGQGVAIDAGGSVAFNEAKSTSSSTSVGVGVGVGVESSTEVDGESGDSTKTDKQSLSAEMALALESSAEGKGSALSGGTGGITIKSGGDVTLQGTESDPNTTIDAAGQVVKKALTSESSSFSMDFAAKVEKETVTETPGNKQGADDAEASPKPADEADAAKNADASQGGDAADATNNETAGGDADGRDKAADDSAKPGSDGTDDAAAKPDAADAAVNKADAPDGADDKGKAPDAPAAEEEEASPPPEIGLFEDNQDGAAEEPAPAEEAGSDTQAQTLSLRNGRVNVPGLRMMGSLEGVEMTDADGQTLPDWVKLDAATGQLLVDKPSDFNGSLEINLALPDGQAFQITVE